MRTAAVRALAVAGFFALVSGQALFNARFLGARSPDLLLAAAVAVAAFPRRGRPSLWPWWLGAGRCALSLDPVLPTLGIFVLASEGTRKGTGFLFGERTLVPALFGFAAALLAPLLRSIVPDGAPLPSAGALFAGAGATAAAAVAFAQALAVLRRRLARR